MNGERVVKQTVMLSPRVAPRGLVTGERLSVDEFLRRWEELPELKNAELIDGVVYEARRSRMPFSAFCRRTAVEICLTSTEVDFGPKLALYQRAGVREYITVERFGELGPEGRHVKPQSEDGAKMLAASNAGLASEDHQRFVERLAAARTQVHGIE